MIPNSNKTKTIKMNASSDAARVCVPIVDNGNVINVLGEFGWEPLPATRSEISSQPRSHVEHSPVTSNGNESRVSDERVKVFPSSARPCPPGIGDLTSTRILITKARLDNARTMFHPLTNQGRRIVALSVLEHHLLYRMANVS